MSTQVGLWARDDLCFEYQARANGANINAAVIAVGEVANCLRAARMGRIRVATPARGRKRTSPTTARVDRTKPYQVEPWNKL